MQIRLILPILILTFLITTSCNKVLLFVMGAEQPEYESDEEVKEYAQKVFDFDGDILRLKSFDEESPIPFGIKNMPTVMYANNGSFNKYVTTISIQHYLCP